MTFNDTHINYGISFKSDGPMNMRMDYFQNRLNFLKKKKIKKLIMADLVHGKRVATILDSKSNIIKNTDGLITKETGITLGITVGDCLPIYFYDPRSKNIGIVHAGWRGVLKNIVANAIKKMETNGAKAKNIRCYIGPHIKKCHFEIRKDVIHKFRFYPQSVIMKNKKIFIDLDLIIREQLLEAGIKKTNLSISKKCTFCDKNFFSFRRDKPNKVESQLAYIGLK